jgi:prepilin-type N-terminal cleavage/methylation domain-containing protein
MIHKRKEFGNRGFTLIKDFATRDVGISKISSNRKSYGFTLIELIIVIAVIGILATAVLAAINPVEQIRKANDSGKRSDASEFLNGVERYFATFQCYPWQYVDGGDCGTAVPAADTMASMKTGSAQGAVNFGLNELVAKNELKAQYATRKGLDKLFVSQDSNDLVHVCFIPESKTFRALATKQRDGETAGCSGYTNSASSCHICVPQ